ncbi:MAG: LPXTG cell wall anchor domain-containing protein [Acidimicrobiia bacterium]|nr:LPXTG cell wall anchor domain-containing protein [Acidimicrobiia bacterium]
MHKRSLVATLLLLAAGLFVPAASAYAQTATQTPRGQIGIRLLEAPVSRENDPRARSYIVDHIAQGTTISRRIEVTNATTTAQTLQLYPGAAVVANGQFAGVDGHGSNDLTSWTSVTPSLLNIPAGQSAQAEVSIAVPQDAHDGERYAVVWAEAAVTTGGGSVQVINRVGIRVYLSVGAGAEPASDFVIESLQAARDDKTHQPVVRAMVRNTGGRALDMSGDLQLKDGPGGITAGPFNVERGTTLGIGQRAPVTVLLDPHIPAGPWNAVIDLRSGEIEHSAQARITFPASGAAKPVKAESLAAKAKIFLPILGILLALIVGLIFAVRRRRKDEYAEVKANLKRFEDFVKAQEGGVGVGTTMPDDPVGAIRAAIKQAQRAGDDKTAAKLESRLEGLLERQAAIPKPALDDVLPAKHATTKVWPREQLAEPKEQEVAPPPPPPAPSPAPISPAPAAAPPSPQPAPVAAPAPETNGDHISTGNGNSHAREDEASLVAILRMLETAAPGGQRFALIKAARLHGREAIESHTRELAALPEDVRVRLLRAAPGQPEAAAATPSEIA